MWFNPCELSKQNTTPLANSANYEPESRKESPIISKLAELAAPLNSETVINKLSTPAILISKLAELASVEWQELHEPKKGVLMVTCYTPAGNPIEVEANNPEHAAFLQRMNPKPCNEIY